MYVNMQPGKIGRIIVLDGDSADVINVFPGGAEDFDGLSIVVRYHCGLIDSKGQRELDCKVPGKDNVVRSYSIGSDGNLQFEDQAFILISDKRGYSDTDPARILAELSNHITPH